MFAREGEFKKKNACQGFYSFVHSGDEDGFMVVGRYAVASCFPRGLKSRVPLFGGKNTRKDEVAKRTNERALM